MCRLPLCATVALPRLGLVIALAVSLAGQAAAQMLHGEVQTRFVVLKNGKVFAGEAERETLKVIVRTETGAVIPFNRDEVDFVADSIEAAADRLSNRIVDDQPQSHIQMAHWCLENRALNGAQREIHWLETWGVKSPEVDELKRRIGIARSVAQNPSAPASHNLVNESARQFHLVVDSIHPELRETFQSDVHMRLVNGCAAARCHGNPAVPMRLWAEGRAGGLNTTGGQRNLIAILEQIDMANPGQSPLLNRMITAHGGQTEPAFSSDSRDWEDVRRWVIGVAATRDEMRRAAEFANSVTKPEIAPAAWQETITPPTRVVSESSHPLPPQAVDLLQEPDKDPVAADPFNPDVFNQKFAGAARPPASRFDPAQLPAAQPVPQTVTGFETTTADSRRAPSSGRIRPLPPVDDDDQKRHWP
jgi:hypothetical protein